RTTAVIPLPAMSAERILRTRFHANGAQLASRFQKKTQRRMACLLPVVLSRFQPLQRQANNMIVSKTQE
ncbi:hypothetical protein BaRGS_00001318, partial [Batillaria attramentaria]